LLHGGPGAQGHRHAEDRLDHLFDPALAVGAGTAEVRHEAGQARSHGMGADGGGDRRVVAWAAVRAGPGVALVFGDAGGDLRQFGDLMPGRLRVLRSAFGRQVVPAAPAGRGDVVDDRLPALRRPADARAGGMAGLGCWRPAAGFLADGLGGGGRVGRRGQRGVAGVLVEARREVPPQRLQFGAAPPPLPTARTVLPSHAPSIRKGGRDSCARSKPLNGYEKWWQQDE
jgi:hypothetical protein